MEHDIFIRYSKKDQETALAILKILEDAGIECWIAPRDVKPGTMYAGELTRGIKNCEMNETMEYYLSDYHWIESYPDPEKHYNKLLQYLMSELKGQT